MSTSKAQQMAFTAKEKAQTVWTSLKSMTMDSSEGDGKGVGLQQRLRKVMEIDNKGEPSAWDSVIKTMFGSCTTGLTEETAPQSLTSKTFESADPISPTLEKEEYFYSQFMTKDRTKAQQAISSVRSQDGKRVSPPPRASSIPKPFPMSSPARNDQQPALQVSLAMLQEAAPPPDGRAIDCVTSFDDGISAISAHTLEEMVHEEERRKGRTSSGIQQILSKESSLFSSSASSPGRIDEGNDKLGKPINLSRPNSRHSKRSGGTRSTRSSHTNDFDSWRRNEAKYWNDVVQQEKGAIKGLPHVQTQTTTSSSHFSGSPFSSAHPHETFPYEACDVINTFEQDEIIKQNARKMRHVLALTHNAELAEI